MPVVLHIYDLSRLELDADGTTFLSCPGTTTFHVALEVHSMEWSFGLVNGVCCGSPGKAFDDHKEVVLGRTNISAEDFFVLIAQLQSVWFAGDYDISLHNCCHFCEALCETLDVEASVWVPELAGAKWDNQLHSYRAHGVTFRTESTAALDKEGLDRQATEKVRSVVLAVDPLSRSNLGALLAAPMPGTYPVLLHVYDLTASDLLGTNSLLRELGTGLFHTTLEVHGLEWSFGHCEHGTGIFSEEHGAGIFSDEELKGDLGFHQVMLMGFTTRSAHEVMLLLDRLEMEWLGAEYDLIRRNCCHFCEALSAELDQGPVPSWVSNLAGVAASLIDGLDIVVRQHYIAAILAAAGDIAMPAKGLLNGVGELNQLLGISEGASRLVRNVGNEYSCVLGGMLRGLTDPLLPSYDGERATGSKPRRSTWAGFEE